MRQEGGSSPARGSSMETPLNLGAQAASLHLLCNCKPAMGLILHPLKSVIINPGAASDAIRTTCLFVGRETSFPWKSEGASGAAVADNLALVYTRTSGRI
ncbi:unnamed protein product [Eretmochelys imbricata]